MQYVDDTFPILKKNWENYLNAENLNENVKAYRYTLKSIMKELNNPKKQQIFSNCIVALQSRFDC